MIGVLKDKGLRVPDGFTTTAETYWRYLAASDLEQEIQAQLDALADGEQSLADPGATIRGLVRGGTFPEESAEAVREAHRTLSANDDANAIDVAARSSATAEDLPEASFAGQQESFLNVRGNEAVLAACKEGIAALFTDRAITYREEQGFDHMQVALSVGIHWKPS
ncbi:MAG: PEP/pyruvate-binding domain-containing protein [Salinibacter sp.]